MPEGGNAAGSGGRHGSLYIKIKAKFFLFLLNICSSLHTWAYLLVFDSLLVTPKLRIIKHIRLIQCTQLFSQAGANSLNILENSNHYKLKLHASFVDV